MEFSITTNFQLTKDLDDLFGALDDALQDLGAEMEARIVAYLKRHDKRATGDLIDSVSFEVNEFISQIKLVVGPTVKYGLAVADGLKPGKWRPIKPLARWARDKFGAVGPEKWAIAYAVRWKIKERGTEASRYMEDTFNFIAPIAAKKIGDRIMAEIA